MARPISDEELQLKKRARRRLVGAIVLVTAVVVALPMVLDTDPRPINQDISIRIPSPDTGTFTSKVVPVAPAPDSKTAVQPPAGATKPEPVADAKPQQPAPAAPKPAAKPPAETVKPPVAPAAAETAVSAAAGQHVVQVIALADAGRARQIQQRISAAGIRSYTEVVTTAQGDVTRVRVGPFDTAAAAEKARGQLQKLEIDGRKLDGKVIQVK